MTCLDVVTGFLGAGKTTLIARYCRWLRSRGVRYCVVENEFGTAGVDGALLRNAGVSVKEISGGCVCCTMKVTLYQLLEQLSEQVDRIILEPSGLFSGDDLLDIVKDSPVKLGMWVGVVDYPMLQTMSDRARQVLSDELIHAGSLVLSKSQFLSPETVGCAEKQLTELLSPPAQVFTAPWDTLADGDWFPALQRGGTCLREHERTSVDHTAMYQSTTFRAGEARFDEGRLREALAVLMDGCAGELLRVKGTLPAEKGFWLINCTPGCISVELSAEGEDVGLNLIGTGLDRRKIRALLEQAK